MNLAVDIASITDKGLNPKYSANEDSHLIMEKEQVFAVADGVGGAFAGELASRAALQIINEAITRFANNYQENKIAFVQKLIEAGNRIIFQMGKKQNKLIASTIAMMLVENNYAILGHVGDSRIYVAREGTLLQLTKDHSKLQELLDQNPRLAVTRDEFSSGHVITRALGVEQQVKPDIQKVILKNNDIFILCTDGIYTNNSDEEMFDIINRNKNDLNNACEIMKKNCYKKGARDNLTAIVLRIMAN